MGFAHMGPEVKKRRRKFNNDKYPDIYKHTHLLYTQWKQNGYICFLKPKEGELHASFQRYPCEVYGLIIKCFCYFCPGYK